MSASNKKKLSGSSQKLTEKHIAEHKQNQEVKMYTIAFTVVMAVVLVIAIVFGSMQVISNSGVRERKTIAYTVGDHQLTSAELNYFFTDGVNNFANQYGPYASIFGLDPNKPLNEQIANEEKGTTWADDFMDTAKESAKSVYTLSDEAKAQGYALSEDEQNMVNSIVDNLDSYAKLNGMGSAKTYLKAVYGNGATLETYRAYLENSMLADSYQAHYAEGLTYEDADIREYEKDRYDEYSSFSYYQYSLSAQSFLEGGTKDDEGNVTYSQEEKELSVKACEAAAKALTGEDIKTSQDLDKAIAALPMNKDNAGAASTYYNHSDYRSMPADISGWLADSSRKTGDLTYIANNTTALNDEGEAENTVSGYTVLMFAERDDNKEMLPNARHILVSYEGGTADENGQIVYSDEEKAAAEKKAQELLDAYLAGEQTEDAFAALATENTMDPGSKEKGGLYENIYRGQMVPTFNDWVFDEARKVGDTGIVATDYGYHVMYYCGEGSLTYRDTMISTELKQADMEKWNQALLDAAATVDGDTSLIRTDIIIAR